MYFNKKCLTTFFATVMVVKSCINEREIINANLQIMVKYGRRRYGDSVAKALEI